MNDDLRAALDATPGLRDLLGEAFSRGWQSMHVAEPVRASVWADEHFELSKESSYTEQKWKCWPFQRAILDCMGHDDIESVTLRKSARVGYSKMLLAAVGYYAQHKRRNQLIYRPTDGDATKWVKSDLDVMLRDVGVMSEVFPEFLRRSKSNTLEQKILVDTHIFVQGGKSAANYRDFTVEVVYLDELDAFDRDVDGEGLPTKLSGKRLEGATWPKHIKGSTPKLRDQSLTEEEHDASDLCVEFHVPCPHCGFEQPLRFGGRGEPTGFRWTKGAPETVVHMCGQCGIGFTQGQYLDVAERGRWKASDGTWIDGECRFRNARGDEIAPPRSIGFSIWSAYSPQTTWAAIATEYVEAVRLKKRGDDTALKTWTNTTHGRSYKAEGVSTSADVLRERAKSEAYRLRLVPRAALLLTSGVDVQDNRFHVLVWGWGRGDESWLIDRRVIYCDPGQWKSWLELDAYLMTRFPHEGGQTCAIDSMAVDIGGHFTHMAYRYCMLRESRRVHATQGKGQDAIRIVAGAPKKQDVNVDGQVVKDGVRLWHIGTDTAKDLIFGRLRLERPGPGYMHLSHQLPSEFFDQLTSEHRVQQKTSRGLVWRWVKPTSHTRNEDLDCTVMAIFSAERMNLTQYTDAEWTALENALCPPTADLFSAVVVPEPLPAPEAIQPATSPASSVQAPEPSQPITDPAPAAEALATPPVWAIPRGRRVRGAVA